jgi:Glycosyltransferase family 87
MLFLAAFALVAVTALACALSLRLSIPGTLLAAYVVASAEVVVVAEALSPFHAISRAGYLASELPFAFAALAVWQRSGRPRPSVPRVSLRRHPLLLALGLAVGIALAFELVLATTTVPNNWDGLTYHLSRAAAWFQQGSLGWLDTHTQRENIFPPNGEIQILFTMVFTHGDHLAGLPQFVAELALLVAVFGIARRLGWGRADAAFAALLFATLSEVVLQATSAQNDLVVSAYVAACAYFVLSRNVPLAALALGLALGTKLTALYALPVLVLLAAATLPRRRLVALAGASAIAFAAVGSLVYVENVVHGYGPLGPKSVRVPFTPTHSASDTVSTTSRLLYRFADLSGYAADIRVRVTVQNAGIFAFDRLGIPAEPLGSTQTPFYFLPNDRANEDVSYFGPLGALLLVPLLLGYCGAFVLRRTSRAKAALALALPLFAVELALTYKYNEWLGRFMLVPVALGAALVARVYAMRLLAGLFAAFGVVFLAFALVHNERKPLDIWSRSRVEAQELALRGGATDPSQRAIAALIPEGARVGVLLGDEDWDYPLYGPHLSRRLVTLPADDPLAAARALGLRWVAIGNVQMTGSHEWSGVRFPGTNWDLLAPKGSPEARAIADYVRRATAQSDSPNGSLSASSALNSGTSAS